MSEGAIVLLIALGAVVLITIGGILVGKDQSRDLEGWLVNSRLMGPILVWFLLGTEIYTAFTFQGLAGYAFTKGSSAFYNVALNDVAYALGFFILPAIWLIGKKFGHVTQSDFLAGRYQSRNLGIFVALASALIMIGYIDLNIEGLGAVIHVIGHNAFNQTVSDLIGFLVLALAVLVGGIRGNAWQSMIKDILMFVAVVAIFIVIPVHYFGSFGHMYTAMIEKLPKYLVLPGVSKNQGPLWLITTVAVTGMGQWMWPQWFGVAYTAKSPRTLKLQAVFMPLYQLVKVMMITVGLAAVLIFTTAKVNGNDVIMLLALKTFPTWFLAVFTVAAVFSAIVPAGPIIMTSAGLIAKNVYGALSSNASEPAIYRLTKGLVFPLTLLAFILAAAAPALIVVVLLVAYDFISQLFPAVVIGGLFWRRATKQGATAGLIVGWVVSAGLLLTKHDPLFGINAGLVALAANLVVFVVVSLLTPAVSENYLNDFLQAAFPQARRGTARVGGQAAPVSKS
ncbi:Na+/solute symporter [Sulfobacillus acidophilus TPY]|uniref:Na+/solute symporter n=1 Tax=Sulfobacillus acidophilus (strain ATCC 700253 / DSM 10332 / NAL) TaxID=679936 RepID=G8TTH4_SULAD|nr:Na+/solute symporter [Sulfobacillus acidophilus TPY]AEW05640.1 Na+/solute symporter [Sulfobacillus acidophilus DSM 10332]